MNKNLASDIELRYTMRVPVKKGGPDVIPAKIFVPIAAVVLYWITQKYSLVDRAAIFIGCAVVPISVFVFMRGLKPLTLFANGDISIPSSTGPTLTLIKKDEIAFYAQTRKGVFIFFDKNKQVLGALAPSSFNEERIFHQWFGLHYSSLLKIEAQDDLVLPRPTKQSFGSLKFLIVAGVLLLLVGYNIFLAVAGPSY